MNKQNLYALILVFGSISFLVPACGQSENYDRDMKKTVGKLIAAFVKEDSAEILNFFENQDAKQERIPVLPRDIKIFKAIAGKYGLPTVDSFHHFLSPNGANIIQVNLLNRIDTALSLSRCDLVVTFYPDQFFKNPNKFLYYTLSRRSIPTGKEFIVEPPDKIKKN